MKAFILSMLALGALLAILLAYLSQPNSLDNYLENAVSEWNRKMDKMFKDFPWK